SSLNIMNQMRRIPPNSDRGCGRRSHRQSITEHLLQTTERIATLSGVILQSLISLATLKAHPRPESIFLSPQIAQIFSGTKQGIGSLLSRERWTPARFRYRATTVRISSTG
ncbi:hypothetical protein U1Q18_023378, partial [Sarracenia purpurea var. burkii]